MARKRSDEKRARKSRKTAQSTKAPSPIALSTALDILHLSSGREPDVAAFLRAALKADPATREGKAALRAAESAALRLARDLKRQARAQGGPLGAELERRAKESYFRAVLARQLPQIIELLRQPRPLPERPAQLEPALPVNPPSKPTNVEAEPGRLSATVRWQPAAGEVVTSFRVTPHAPGGPQVPTTVTGTIHETPVLGLIAGTAYRFSVRASNPKGASAESDLSDPPVTPLGPPVPPIGGGPLDLVLPAFSSDPALLIDKAAEPLRAYVADAARIGQKWRYEHLKTQAIAAAREAMQYEEHIARLMGMALDKLGTAEVMLNATLIEAVKRGQDILDIPGQAAESPELDSLLDPLGETAAQALLLPRLLAFLVETGPLKFWIGLFEAIICDLASVVPFFGGATSLGRTRKYLKTVFDDPLSGVQAGLAAAANDILSRLDGEIEQMIAPLRAATDQVIEGTRKAMADVFEGFDVTLLMTPSEVPGGPDVPDLDPLEELYEQLNAQVNELAEKVKARVTEALSPLTQLTGGGGALFETIVITFLVLPILAFLVISLAGGPFSAALLAAAVLLAAEELLRLLVQWLAGPLLKKIGELQQRLTELVGRLQSFFALQAALVQNMSPEEFLRILASQLRQLRDFLPQEFLEEAAGVLQEARNVVLRTATQLGLAAEQALGSENASAFEAISEDYATHLAPAPQLPGGTDPSRLAGAALLRDFGRLEEQRTAIRDGKEIEFTHRLSLLRLLGGDPAQSMQQFIQRRELLVSLTERDLIDRMFPGVYRAVIKDVRATGILGGIIHPRLHGIPLTITHRGESRTRIKRSANPFAPPVELPKCFPDIPFRFSQPVVGPRLIDPFFPDDLPDDAQAIAAISTVFSDPLRDQIRRAFEAVPLETVRIYQIIFNVLSFESAAAFICRPFCRALLAQLPESLERAAIEKSCGLVDPTTLIAAARSLLRSEGLVSNILLPVLLQPGPNNNRDIQPALEPALGPLADRLRAGFTFENVKLPGLVAVAQEAWKEGKAAFLRRVARWGDFDFEEDPDPQVRALGFVRLVRRAPSETMVYNLFPPGPATGTRAEPAAGVSDGSPFVPASALQYRPFENRGIEGDLLLRLESLDDDAILPPGAGAAIAQLSGNLTDIVLDITVRGCYDADLAQTVRASRRQTASDFNVASRLPGALGPIGLPDSLVRVEAGATELRSVRYSLRAHRDKTLQVLSAAVLAQPTAPVTLRTLIEGKAVLGRDAAFESLDPAVSSFKIELSSAPLANSVAALQGLVGTLRVSPGDLGFDAGLLSGHDVVEPARLVSLGVAVIPMPEGVRAADAELTDDPMNVELQVTGLLGNVFPGFGSAAALPQRLKMTIPAEADPPAVADLFSAGVVPALTFDLAGALAGGSRLYDVIVSFTYRVPALRVRTVINALR
ncbi:MAG TPA: fibronectin type III domain-containing protein [Thermoanaerobaculia bacterium]|nr:fibronectin type III domain-containing protein [Thermoanaerobaculia bacterium]